MMKAAFFSNNLSDVERVYGLGRKECIAAKFDLYDTVITSDNINDHLEKLADLELIFSTWGMLRLSEEQLDAMPKLKAVLYAASSVKYFAEPFLKRGIQVVSAAAANAEFVANFAASQIQLAAKGYFHNFRTCGYKCMDTRSNQDSQGVFEINIGLVGAGFVSRQVISRISGLPGVHLQVYDPYLSDEQAKSLNVKKVSLEDMFRDCYVVSNHAPDTPETHNMLHGALFASMQKNATFINTGRGVSVHEGDMVRVLKERPDLVALIDVTVMEPPSEDSPMYGLPNLFYTTHIAGAFGKEVCYMADMCIREAEMIQNGQLPPHGVTLERLKTMA